MAKLKKIGGLLFKKTKTGLHYAGVAGKKTYHGAKYLHGVYKTHKAGEISRLREKSEKERIRSQIRHYKQQYKPKSHAWESVEKFFSPSKPVKAVKHVKHRFPKRHRHRRVIEYW